MERGRKAVVSRTRLLAHHVCERGDLFGASRLAAPDALEKREAVGDQDPAGRGRRVRNDIEASVAHLHGPPPDDAIPGEVLAGQEATARHDCIDRRARELAGVERAGALLGDLLERPAEIGQAQHVAREEAGAVGPAVETAPLVRVTQDQVEDRMQVRLRPVQLDARTSELDRRLQELAPGKPAVAPVQRLEAHRRARYGARRLADPEDLDGLVVAKADVDRVHGGPGRRRAPLSRRRDEEIGHPRRAPVARDDQGEAARARPGERAFGHPGRECGCHTGVGGVSALLQDPRARRRRQRMPGRNRAIHAFVISADELCACISRSESSPFHD